MNNRQIEQSFWVRYVNVFVICILAFDVPMPVNRIGLLVCTVFTLVGNIAFHAFARRTLNYGVAGYSMLFVDVISLIPAIYITGMVTSPFFIVLPLTLYTVYFVNFQTRITRWLGIVSLTGLLCGYGLWLHLDVMNLGWRPSEYPMYTAFVVGMQVFSVIAIIYQSTFLPSPLLQSLLQRESELIRQSKTAELGLSLAMVVHELRNPLTTISASLEIAQDRFARLDGQVPNDVKRSVDRGMKEMARVRRMLDNLMTYSRDRRGVTRRESVNVREVVDSAIEFIRLKYGQRSVMFKVTGATAEMLIEGDQDTIYQVVVNLFCNAVTAQVKGRKLQVDVIMSTTAAMHEILVRDNGCGMPPELVARIFQPFVSARHSGTGLGMPIVLQILKDHGGTIDLTSAEGKGTTFRMHLPVRGTVVLPDVIAGEPVPVSSRT